jgi:hypothetical protein
MSSRVDSVANDYEALFGAKTPRDKFTTSAEKQENLGPIVEQSGGTNAGASQSNEDLSNMSFDAYDQKNFVKSTANMFKDPDGQKSDAMSNTQM